MCLSLDLLLELTLPVEVLLVEAHSVLLHFCCGSEAVVGTLVNKLHLLCVFASEATLLQPFSVSSDIGARRHRFSLHTIRVDRVSKILHPLVLS